MTDIVCSYIKLMLECNCNELEMMIHQVFELSYYPKTFA